jgi:hypothetical protein
LLLAGIVLRFGTPQGQLRVEVNGDDLEVLVDGETISLKNKQWEGKKAQKPHQLALKLAGREIPFNVETQQFVINDGKISVTLGESELRAPTFELSRDKTTVLRIDFILSPSVASNSSPVTDNPPPTRPIDNSTGTENPPADRPAAADENRIRQIAERIFERGGYVSFFNRKHKSAFRAAELPADDFQINVVGFSYLEMDVEGGHISLLSELPDLEIVSFSQVSLTDAAVTELAKLQIVKELHFKKVNLTNKWLSQLTVLKNLEMMEIFHTELTNEGLKKLADFPALRRLSLVNAAKTQKFGEPILNDDGLVHLSKIKNLERLWLLGPNFTDAAVDHLVAIKSLRELLLGAHDITAEGVEELKRRLHKECRFSLASRLRNPHNEAYLDTNPQSND